MASMASASGSSGTKEAGDDETCDQRHEEACAERNSLQPYTDGHSQDPILNMLT
jgi:hypothetical protein